MTDEANKIPVKKTCLYMFSLKAVPEIIWVKAKRVGFMFILMLIIKVTATPNRAKTINQS